jgi:diguanylate cyclase (GGDEF)-like protein
MAFPIRRLKIRDQFFLVSLPPFFVLLCAIALFFYAYWIEVNTNRSTQRTEEGIARGESLLRRLTEMHLGLSGYLFTRQSPFLGPYDAAASGLASDLNALRELESDDFPHAAEIDAIRTEIDRWQAEWVNPTIGKVRRGEAVDIQPAVVEGQGRLDSLRNRILKLLEEDREKDVAKRFQAERVIRRMLFLELGITLLLGGALLFLTWTITHIIADPVKQLIAASEKVSRGEFEFSLPPPSDNEFGVLSQSFSRMTAALRLEREEMAALNKFSQAVTQCTSEREVYQHLLHSLKERFEPRQVIIFSLNSQENVLEAVVTLSPLPEKLRPWPVIEEPHNCKAIRMGTPFLVNDVTRAPLCPAEFAPPTEGSYYCRPLIAGGNIIGAVRLEGPKDYWTSEREDVLENYLSSAASALSNLRLLDTTKRLAEVDSLTGLYNRRFLEEYARKAIAGARRKEQPVGFIMVDLDHLKAANDIFGHEAGDRILRQFAKTVTGAMRETNLVARFGGEEFLVLLPDTNAKACMLVAERLRKAVARMVVPEEADKPLQQTTVSLGVAVYPDHGQTLEEILQAADRALYESKRAGRNRSTLYVEQVEPAT